MCFCGSLCVRRFTGIERLTAVQRAMQRPAANDVFYLEAA